MCLKLAGDLIGEATDAGARRSDTDLVIYDEVFRDVDFNGRPLLDGHIRGCVTNDHHLMVDLSSFLGVQNRCHL